MVMHAPMALTTPAPYAAPTTPAPAQSSERPTDERCTEADALCAGSVAPTWPPLSANRAAGIVWAESLLAQARACTLDASRFAAGLAL